MAKRFNPKNITKDILISELQKYAKEIGRTPSQNDMKNSNSELVKKVHLYRKKFGSIKNAQMESGLESNKAGSDMKYSDEEMLGEINKIHNMLSRIPSQGDIGKYCKIPIGAFKRRFGTYRIAVKRAGLGTNNVKIFSLEDIKNDIVRISTLLGRSPTSKEFSEYSNTVSSVTAMHKVANNEKWNDVITICGLDPSYHRNITNGELRNEIVRLQNKLGYVPGYNDMSNIGNYAAETYASKFGTYLKALKFFGFNYEPQNQWSNQVYTKGKDNIYYKSKFEALAGNTLYYLKIENKIKSYEYDKPVCSDRKWTCDFYIVDVNGQEIWVETDGMEHRRDEQYIEHNQKIQYYIKNNYNYHIIPYSNYNVADQIFKIIFNNQVMNVEELIKNYNLKGRVKKWDGPSVEDFVETNNINIKKYYFDTIIKWKKHELTAKFLSSISEGQRDEIAKDLLMFFKKYDFYNVKYTASVINSDISSIMNYNLTIDDQKHINNNINMGLKVCHEYFPNIQKISSQNLKSVYDVLKDDEILFKIIRNRIGNTFLSGSPKRQHPFNITPSMIIRGAKSSGLANSGSLFKPSIAKLIYSHWVKDNQVVYDYSSGFGARLLGFYASGINAKYIGTDPNSETYSGLCKMRDDFRINADIYNIPSEDFIPNEKVHFAFSSPPYFNSEIYTDEQTQSYYKFLTYKEWLNSYWTKTMENIKSCLHKDGIFSINVGSLNGNKKMQNIHDSMVNIIQQHFDLVDSWFIKTPYSHFNKSKGFKLEPIHFFKLK